MMNRASAGAAALGSLLLLASCGGGGGGDAVGADALGAGPDFVYMNEVMQIRAETIWNSAGYIISAEGERSLAPTTDEGWAAVAAGAESVKAAGEELKSVAWRRDDESWIAFADGIIVAGERARLGAVAHSEDEIFESGAQLYRVCVACHQFYRVGAYAPEE